MIVFCWYICILVYLQWSIKRWAGILPGALSDLTGESAFLPLVSTGWKSFNHLSPDIYSDQLSNSVFLKLSQSAENFTSKITRVNSLAIMLKGVFFVESLRTPFKRYELPWMICESTKKNMKLGVTLALDSKLVFLCVFDLQKCHRVIQHNQKDHHSDLVPQRKSLYHMT